MKARPVEVRTGQDVVLVAGNFVAAAVESGRTLEVIPVALNVAMQVGNTAGDHHAPCIVPRSIADAVARIDTRRRAPLFLTEIGVPCVIKFRTNESREMPWGSF